MRLTKKIRHQIYIEALNQEYKYRKIMGESPGLCYDIFKALGKYFNLEAEELDKKLTNKLIRLKIYPFKSIEVYPEILKHRPKNFKSFWFPRNTKQAKTIRTKILKQAIKETE